MERWYDETFAGGSRMGLRMSRTVFEGRSEHQRVEILETDWYGRVLVIDGVFMTSEHDDFFYHEMIVHPAMLTVEAPERVLVVGGGDGGTAREVLRHPGVREVVMVEIDGLVVEACRRHMPALGAGAWDDPRLHVRIGDGVAFAREAASASFDVVILDGTDPVGPGEGLFDEAFFRDCRRVLRPGGAFAGQTESPFYFPELFARIQRRLRAAFESVRPYFGPVPLYAAGEWSWTLASDRDRHQAVDLARLTPLAPGCRYYNRDVHASAFAVPNHVRALLA